MNQYLTPRQFARTAVIDSIVLIAAVAVIRSQRGDDAGIVAPLKREEADAPALELARCRTVTLDQTASLGGCRRVWAENRRQFFKPTKTPAPSAESLPTAAAAPGKSQDRASPVNAEHWRSEVR